MFWPQGAVWFFSVCRKLDLLASSKPSEKMFVLLQKISNNFNNAPKEIVRLIFSKWKIEFLWKMWVICSMLYYYVINMF